MQPEGGDPRVVCELEEVGRSRLGAAPTTRQRAVSEGDHGPTQEHGPYRLGATMRTCDDLGKGMQSRASGIRG